MHHPLEVQFDKRAAFIHNNIREAIHTAVAEIFFENRYSNHVLERLLKSNKKWGGRDRRLIAETVFDITRYWRLLLEVFDEYGYPDKASIEHITSFYFFLKGVESERERGYKKEMQRFHTLLQNRVSRESIPDFFDKYAEKQLGTRWEKELVAMNQPADVYLRVNTLLAAKKELIIKLEKEEITAEPVDELPDALKLTSRKNLFLSEAFRAGLFEIQEASSQMVAPFMELSSGMRVVDACAGGGGKSLHIASIMKNTGRIISMDTEKWKLEELSKRAKRNKISNIETRVIESMKTIKRLAGSADRVLLDAPCSGSGVIRRNPDTKWKLNAEMMQRLKDTQKTILLKYSQMVKPGGLIVYSTCSFFPEENNLQVEYFLKENPLYTLVEEMNIYPSDSGFDGFYMAKIARKL